MWKVNWTRFNVTRIVAGVVFQFSVFLVAAALSKGLEFLIADGGILHRRYSKALLQVLTV
jgi:hypothetical protein